jgi:hypothetical protein
MVISTKYLYIVIRTTVHTSYEHIVDWTAEKEDKFGKSFQTTQLLWKHEIK